MVTEVSLAWVGELKPDDRAGRIHIGAIVLSQLLPQIDARVASNPWFTYSASSAQATLSAISSGMIAFTGFVFSVLTFAIQYGSTAFTPRLLRSISTDGTTKVALGVFVATFTYSLLLLAEVAPAETRYVPQWSVLFAVVLVGASIMVFLRLIASLTARCVRGSRWQTWARRAEQ